ncbi:MAG: hypothetical protein WAM94_06935, partial [Chromatiaceae bacterium]
MSHDSPRASVGGEPVVEAPSPEAPDLPAAPSGLVRRYRLSGVLRLLFGLTIQLALLVLILVVLVLGTQTGLRTALAIAGDLAPGMIQIGKVEGRVLGRLHLEDLRVHVPDLDLTVGSFDLDWSPLTALTGTLRIHRVAASDIDVVAAPGEA